MISDGAIDEGYEVKLAVLDYGIGNLRSAQKALERLGASAVLTADPEVICAADGVVLPGVGAFGACMKALRATGLAEQAVAAAGRGQPFLGICVGMQLLFDGSDESPEVDGLGILPGRVRQLPATVKRPQMQWNRLRSVKRSADEHAPGQGVDGHPLMHGLDGEWMYFVHSFVAEPGPLTIASVDYGGEMAAAVADKNVSAVQFHPEKSSDAGMKLLANFLRHCRAEAVASKESA